MGKRHLLHVKSSQVVTNEGGTFAKLPSSGDVEYGEIAINYAKDYETLSIRNSANEIIPLYFRGQGNGIDNVKVNSIKGSIEKDGELTIASVSISGSNIPVSSGSNITIESAITEINNDITILKANSGHTIVSGGSDITVTSPVGNNKTYTVSTSHKIPSGLSATTPSDLTRTIYLTDSDGKTIGNGATFSVGGGEIYYGNVSALTINNVSADTIDSTTGKIQSGATCLNIKLNGKDIPFSGEGSISIYSAITEAGKVDNINVNGVLGKVENKIAIVNISGDSIPLTSAATSYVSVAYPEPFGTVVSDYRVSAATTVSSAFTNVEKQISALTQQVIDDEETYSNAFEKTAIAVGNILNEKGKIVYIPNTNVSYISSATSHNDAIVKLANFIKSMDTRVQDLGNEIIDLKNEIERLKNN